MNMKKTARIALEMLDSAVLCALLEAKRSDRGRTLSVKDIQKIIGIRPYSQIVRDTLNRLLSKHYVERSEEDPQRWYITAEGESFFQTDFQTVFSPRCEFATLKGFHDVKNRRFNALQ